MSSTISADNLSSALTEIKARGARFAIVVMVEDGGYGKYKLIADSLGFLTQNVKLKTVLKNPRGISSQIALKLNSKLGGINHVLASRLPPNVKKTPDSWQKIPASISWLFEKPAMLVGIDVSHPDRSSDAQSVAAVVGSLDNYCSQYAAVLSIQKSRKEMVTALEDNFVKLLKAFKIRNNGNLPATIVVFRDGVGESQYDQVIKLELPAIKGAVELMGQLSDSIKVCVVISQKGHNTRLFFEELSGALINVCPGIVIDSRGRRDSIVSENLPEFFLNSHHAALGTSKPTKYTVIYDEIGIKNSELQILTYWSTYLYARCNKSVSLATPVLIYIFHYHYYCYHHHYHQVYYSHWASRRGAQLLAAGAAEKTLEEICNLYAASTTPMFFI